MDILLIIGAVTGYIGWCDWNRGVRPLDRKGRT